MSASFFGINMSGDVYNVVNSSGSKIGSLYNKERFTYSFDLKTINGKKHKKIWFLKPNGGGYGEGYLLDSYSVNNWMNYRFYNSNVGYHFKIDGRAGIYTANGQPTVSYGTGCLVIPEDNAVSSSSIKNYLAIKSIYIPNGGGYLVHELNGFFIDTGVAYNSTNTVVYGNWN